jgi:hypothetical protein
MSDVSMPEMLGEDDMKWTDEKRAAISYNARWPSRKKVSLANQQQKPEAPPITAPPAKPSVADLLDMLKDQPNQGPTAILSLHWTDCKWPIGDIMTDPDNFKFCREPRVMLPSQGRGGGERLMSYCAEHCRMAYGTRR